MKEKKNKKDELTPYLARLCKRLKEGDTKEECVNHIWIDGNPHINFELLAKHLINKGKRERTIKQYLFTIHNYWAEVSEKSLENYTDYIYRKSLSSTNSINRKNYSVYVCLKHYCIAIKKREWLKHLHSDDIKKFVNNTRNISITQEEINYIIEKVPPMYQVMMILMRSTGLRISETLYTKRSWIFFKRNPTEIVVPTDISKSGKEGIVFLTEKASDIIEKYIKKNNIGEYSYLFILKKDKKHGKNKDLRCIEAEQVEFIKILRSIAPQRIKKQVSAHWFRYNFAKMLYKANIDIHKIQLLMRHSDLKVTTLYIDVDKKALQESHKSAEKLLD